MRIPDVPTLTIDETWSQLVVYAHNIHVLNAASWEASGLSAQDVHAHFLVHTTLADLPGWTNRMKIPSPELFTHRLYLELALGILRLADTCPPKQVRVTRRFLSNVLRLLRKESSVTFLKLNPPAASSGENGLSEIQFHNQPSKLTLTVDSDTKEWFQN